MQKTFCDRCGTECKNFTLHLHGTVSHATSRGESVGYDDIQPVELCKTCADTVTPLLGLKIRDPESYGKAEMRERPLREEDVWRPPVPLYSSGEPLPDFPRGDPETSSLSPEVR